MGATTVYCYILDGDVTIITDLNGQVTNVICPEFQRLNHACRLKGQDKGTIMKSWMKVVDTRLNTRMRLCEFVTPGQSPTDI